MKINPNKNIGRVLIIVEGSKTEFYIIHKVFTEILGYQLETIRRSDKPEGKLKYKKYNETEGIESSVFVVNPKESAVSHIIDGNEYLDNMFRKLIEDYNFPVDRSAIYYLFDRDVKSNPTKIVNVLIESLTNSREANDISMRKGLFLLSYPSLESFVASNFIEDTIEIELETGTELKGYLNQMKVNQSQITLDTLLKAVEEMEKALIKIGVDNYDVDAFAQTNKFVYEHQEEFYIKNSSFRCLSLLSIMLLDLGIIQTEDDL